MTTADAMSHGTSQGTPQVLLAHYLKQLRLPTVLREYDKVARECARDSVAQRRMATKATPSDAAAGDSADLDTREILPG